MRYINDHSTLSDKELDVILNDVFPRVHYGVYCRMYMGKKEGTTEDFFTTHCFKDELDDLYCYWIHDGAIRPYLRPMDSMTDEEKKRYYDLRRGVHETGDVDLVVVLIEWLNKWGFDHHHLIDYGLAVPAEDWMYADPPEERSLKKCYKAPED